MPSKGPLSRLVLSVKEFADDVLYHAHTMFLFGKSDIKTTLIPVTFFALGAAPLSRTHPLSHALQSIFWIWLHLFKFNLSNQVRDPAEDAHNKPWRPLPSKRITLSQTLLLKELITILSLLFSMCYSPAVFLSSAIFALLVPMYHEMHGDRHWASKNLMNAVGYACFASGGTLVAADDRTKLDQTSWLAIIVISSVLATTIQAQDFQDVPGDKLVGRSTLPIAHPRVARHTVYAVLLVWSVYLTAVWEVDWVGTGVFWVLGALVGARYYFLRSVQCDEVSYVLYNVWLAGAFMMPGYWRMFKENVIA